MREMIFRIWIYVWETVPLQSEAKGGVGEGKGMEGGLTLSLSLSLSVSSTLSLSLLNFLPTLPKR